MGKRNYRNGIIDRRYDRDGSPTGYARDLPFRAYCHYAGEPQYSKCFPTFKEAQDWKRDQDEQNRNKDNIGYFKRKELEKRRELKVSDVLYNYIHTINRGRNRELDDLSGPTDLLTLHRTAQSSLGRLPLIEATKPRCVKYFQDRLRETYTRKGWRVEKPITARTVSRERAIIQRAFQTAIDENWWDVCYGIENPAKGIRIQGSMYKRSRALLPSEEEKLVAAFDDCLGLNRYYAPLAMYLAIETGMRQQEVVNLRWSDIDFIHRRIKIRKSKTDKKLAEKGVRPGRSIVLTVDSMMYLIDLWHHLNEGRLPGAASNLSLPNVKRPIDDPDSCIFINKFGKQLSTGALGDVFSDAVRRAELKADENGETLTFHDLRREANIRFRKADLDREERNVMIGHYDGSQDETYDDREREHYLKRIQDKLDHSVLKLAKTAPVKDANGKIIRHERVLDQYGEPIWYGVTLEEYASVGRQHKVTNEDIFDRKICVPHITQHGVIAIHNLTSKSDAKTKDRLANGKVYVCQVQDADGKWIGHLVPLGFLTICKAAEITKCTPVNIIDAEWKEGGATGLMSQNGFWFFTEWWLEEQTKDVGENIALADRLDFIKQYTSKKHGEDGTAVVLFNKVKEAGHRFIKHEPVDHPAFMARMKARNKKSDNSASQAA